MLFCERKNIEPRVTRAMTRVMKKKLLKQVYTEEGEQEKRESLY